MPLYSCADNAQDAIKLDSLEKQGSYAFGVNIANRIKSTGLTFETEALSQGISDAMSGRDLRLPQAELKKAHAEFIKQAQAFLQQQKQSSDTANLESGNLFLEENAKKEGVITTNSGLQYKVITPGTGAMPKETDTVVTHYRGTTIDGKEFDSSYKRNQPASFPVKGVIKGWTEALQLMKVGAKWQLFIPSNLAYGAQKRSELIQPNTTLIFELELLDVKS